MGRLVSSIHRLSLRAHCVLAGALLDETALSRGPEGVAGEIKEPCEVRHREVERLVQGNTARAS